MIDNKMLITHNKHFVRTLVQGLYKGRIKGSVESDAQFLTKYEGVSSYLKRNFPPTLAEIAKLCDCSKNTVQKVKKILRRISKDSAI